MATKRRNKKYRPKPVRYASVIANIADPVTEEQLKRIALGARVPLDAVRRGEGTVENCMDVVSALQELYLLAAGFEDKGKIQALAYVARAGMNGAAQYIVEGLPIPECLTEAAFAALDVLEEMERQVDRRTMVDMIRVLRDNRRTLLKIPKEWAFVYSPTGNDDISECFGKRGLTYLNGVVRTGMMRHNDEMERDEWVDVVGGCTVALTKPTLILLEMDGVKYE